MTRYVGWLLLAVLSAAAFLMHGCDLDAPTYESPPTFVRYAFEGTYTSEGGEIQLVLLADKTGALVSDNQTYLVDWDYIGVTAYGTDGVVLSPIGVYEIQRNYKTEDILWDRTLWLRAIP